jgi:hypothetical protein
MVYMKVKTKRIKLVVDLELNFQTEEGYQHLLNQAMSSVKHIEFSGCGRTARSYDMRYRTATIEVD